MKYLTLMQGKFIAVARTFSCWGGEFPADLKFYWLHFEVLTESVRSLPPALLNVPQHTRVSDPQYIISLFRQFLREQENIHRSPALELLLLLILQQIAAAASENRTTVPALRWHGKRSRSSIPVTTCLFQPRRWRKSCTVMLTI